MSQVLKEKPQGAQGAQGDRTEIQFLLSLALLRFSLSPRRSEATRSLALHPRGAAWLGPPYRDRLKEPVRNHPSIQRDCYFVTDDDLAAAHLKFTLELKIYFGQAPNAAPAQAEGAGARRRAPALRMEAPVQRQDAEHKTRFAYRVLGDKLN
jgi:hypothetical protein